MAIKRLDPTRGNKKAADKRKKEIQKRLGRKVETDGAYEDVIAQEVVNPDDIDVTLKDIGGLENVIEAMRNQVIAPLQRPDLFRASLLRQAKGMLLYGPPGTGKTLLAKALAKESQAMFINIRASTLLSKWFGDTQKLVSAIFSLAFKIQPCIVFIDEVDALLGKRRDNEHEAVTSMKTEFMQLWDGFLTSTSTNIMVLAATNRPYELDPAVLRRFSVKYEVPLPNPHQRAAIMLLHLRRHAADAIGGVDPSLLSGAKVHDGLSAMEWVAQHTEGYSGSDLQELLSEAAAIPVHEYIRESEDTGPSAGPSSPRPMDLSDIEHALTLYKPSWAHAEEYRHQEAAALPVNLDMVRQIQMLLASTMAQAPQAPPAPQAPQANQAPPRHAPGTKKRPPSTSTPPLMDLPGLRPAVTANGAASSGHGGSNGNGNAVPNGAANGIVTWSSGTGEEFEDAEEGGNGEGSEHGTGK